MGTFRGALGFLSFTLGFDGSAFLLFEGFIVIFEVLVFLAFECSVVIVELELFGGQAYVGASFLGIFGAHSN